MKKSFIALFAMLCCVATANAQFYAGGSFGFTSTTYDNGGKDESGSSFKIIPEIGYKVNDNISAGIQIGYSHGLAAFGSLTVSDLKSALSTAAGAYADIANDDMKLSGFTISPYARFTVTEMGPVKLFIEAYIGYNNITSDPDDGDKITLNSFELGARPGLSYALGERVEAICKIGCIGYMSAKEKEEDLKVSRFGVAADTYNLLIGVNFNF